MADNWGNSFENTSSSRKKEDDDTIVRRIHTRYRDCDAWEAQARIWFDYDYKFSNADAHNKYQWDDKLVYDRELQDKPCLTINKTQQHNLLIINDAKQNKPGIRIRPVGEEASFEAAQLFQEIVYHIEYISSAENIYDSATTWQVEAGIGYWRVCTDFISDKTFDQEIYIKRIKDPRSVFLDPDINEVDGSDARYGFIFEDMPKELYKTKYPDFVDAGSSVALGNASNADTWISKEHIRVAEYYEKTEKKEKLVTFLDPKSNDQAEGLYSTLSDEGKALYKVAKADPDTYQFKERNIVTSNIKWYKIAGTTIIDRGDWAGKYIPIVRLPGTETVIDGILDRKGHTRALINAQQIYNYNTSANVEYGALQTKSPWVAPNEAIEGYEDYWESANVKNHSFLPYNHIGDDGKPIPAPTRPQAPQASPAYVQQMQIANQEMMMASGQYQSQFGENENAKSGVAINARQRQGDRATYHFIDNQAIAIRFTGKIMIDLIPKIYDTKRIMKITAQDGSRMNVIIDPKAPQAFQKQDNSNAETDPAKKIDTIIFNPNVGMYDLQADSGPSYATKRMEAFQALTQIAAQNKEFMNTIGGDIYFKNADFPFADILAQRYERILSPQVKGEAPNPQQEMVMQQASEMIQKLQGALQEANQKLESKQADLLIKKGDLDIKLKELDLKEKELVLKEKEVAVIQQRADYDAETKRLTAVGNAGPMVSVDQLQPVLKQLIVGMLNAHEPGQGDIFSEKFDGLKPAPQPIEGAVNGNAPGMPSVGNGSAAATDIPSTDSGMPSAEPIEPAGAVASEGVDQEQPPMEGARKAPDGRWYVQNPNGQGYLRIEPNAASQA